MSARECGVCVARVVADGAAICVTCSDALAEALRRLPGLLEDLHTTYSKQDRLGDGGHRGTLAEPPLPIRFGARRVMDALSAELTTWARVLVDHHRWDVPDPPRRRPHNDGRGVVIPVSSPGVDLACYAAMWLAEHLDYLRIHPAALEAHQGLTGAIEMAQAVMDRPEVQLFVGYCATPRPSGGLCGASLYAPHNAQRTRCERCGTWVTDLAQRWERALVILRGCAATAADIEAWICDVYGVAIKRKRVNDWHHRGTLQKVDDDPGTGDPRFKIGEVLDRAARSKPRKAG